MPLEFPHPAGYLQTALQRAVDLVAFGLRASDDAMPVELTIPGSFGHVSPAQNRALSVEDARTEFRSWVVANGFRECVESIGPALEWLRKTCFFWTRPGTIAPIEEGKIRLSSTMTGADWNTHIVGAAPKFDRLPLPDKLLHLENTYGWQRPDLCDHVLSINAARNCLAHRAGIVGKKDLKADTDTELIVRWRRLHLSVGSGTQERTLNVGSHVEAEELLSASFIDTEKRVRLGERLTITADEFVEICLTFLLFSMQLEQSVKQLQDQRRPPDAASPGL